MLRERAQGLAVLSDWHAPTLLPSQPASRHGWRDAPEMLLQQLCVELKVIKRPNGEAISQD